MPNAKTFKVLKGDFVLLWLSNQVWGTISIPSHVLLIYLHPQKLGQSHRAQTIHLSFVLTALLSFSNTQNSTYFIYGTRTVYLGGTEQQRKGYRCTICD